MIIQDDTTLYGCIVSTAYLRPNIKAVVKNLYYII